MQLEKILMVVIPTYIVDILAPLEALRFQELALKASQLYIFLHAPLCVHVAETRILVILEFIEVDAFEKRASV